jgi:hypothetical protein
MRALATSLMVLALAACGGDGGSDGNPPPMNYIDYPPLWNDYAVGLGETINLADSVSINFVSVDEDTRCPTGATCADQGNARITVQAFTLRGSFMITLNTDPNLPTSALFDYYGVSLRKLEPYPALDAQGQATPIPSNNYVATVFVVKAGYPP